MVIIFKCLLKQTFLCLVCTNPLQKSMLTWPCIVERNLPKGPSTYYVTPIGPIFKNRPPLPSHIFVTIHIVFCNAPPDTPPNSPERDVIYGWPLNILGLIFIENLCVSKSYPRSFWQDLMSFFLFTYNVPVAVSSGEMIKGFSSSNSQSCFFKLKIFVKWQ